MRSFRSVLPLLLAPLALLVSGCGPDCQSSCDKLFGDAPDQCDLASGLPGVDPQNLRADCLSHCNGAMARNGEVSEDFNPDERSSGADEVTLDNEKEAALWMDCVADSSCENLNEGYCAPTTVFP